MLCQMQSNILVNKNGKISLNCESHRLWKKVNVANFKILYCMGLDRLTNMTLQSS